MQSTQEKHEAEIISYDENERVDDGSFGRVVGDGWSAAAPSTSAMSYVLFGLPLANLSYMR